MKKGIQNVTAVTEPALTCAAGRRRRSEQGFSLIELMIAMVIGLVLIGGMIAVFSGNRQSARLNQALATLQEQGRFAMESMVRDARMAGFQGCTDATVEARILASDAPTDNYITSAVSAATVLADGSWDPAYPLAFSPPDDQGRPVPGTHALVVQFGNPETSRISAMPNAAADIVVEGEAPAIVSGDVALISNCQVADIFRATAVSDKTIKHTAAGNSGINQLSAPYGQSPTEDAIVTRFESNIYYVGDTGRSDENGNSITALYRQTLPYSDDPIEMIEGVSNMRLRLGFRDATLNNNLVYLSPEDSDSGTGMVENIQVGLLLQSREPIAELADTQSYRLAGDLIENGASDDPESNQYLSDKRLRIAFNTSVSVRNR